VAALVELLDQQAVAGRFGAQGVIRAREQAPEPDRGDPFGRPDREACRRNVEIRTFLDVVLVI